MIEVDAVGPTSEEEKASRRRGKILFVLFPFFFVFLYLANKRSVLALGGGRGSQRKTVGMDGVAGGR